MTTRSYAAARRTLSNADKLLDVNWGLVLLITLIACVGFAMQYSVADGHFHPWALPQMEKFALGIVILVVVALVDIRIWMNVAYPFYGVALLLLIATTVMGKVGGLGAQRWLELGPLQLQPSEFMKISLVMALARFLHGRAVEEVSHPLWLGIRQRSCAPMGRRFCFWRGCRGGGSFPRSASGLPPCLSRGASCMTIKSAVC
jgi:rod shape determining protein RodA